MGNGYLYTTGRQRKLCTQSYKSDFTINSLLFLLQEREQGYCVIKRAKCQEKYILTFQKRSIIQQIYLPNSMTIIY